MAKDRIVPCIIHVPCQYPDGTQIEPEKLNLIFEALDRQFGGSTPLGIVPGRWVAPDGTTVVENMHRIEVSVKESAIQAFELTARQIGRETQQQAMYVIINYQGEARLLWADDDGGGLAAAGS